VPVGSPCVSARSSSFDGIVTVPVTSPQGRKLEPQRLERWDRHDCLVAMRAHEAIRRSIQPEHLERARQRIDEPHVTDAFARVDGHLVGTIDCRGGRGEDLTGPVWCELEGGRLRHLRHPFPPPPRQVGNENIAVQMKLRFIENDPSAWTANAAIERAVQEGTHARCRARVWRRRTRKRMELAIDELRDQVIRNCGEVVVRCPTLVRRAHPRIVKRTGEAVKMAAQRGREVLFHLSIEAFERRLRSYRRCRATSCFRARRGLPVGRRLIPCAT
jgi:hypothetical protein